MTVEIVLLALASSVRPTSLAAVYALLSGDSPRRLLILYVAAGLAFTIAFGLIVILAFNGVQIQSGTDRTKGIAEIAGGIVIIGFAACVMTGRVGGGHASDAPRPPGRWAALRERRFTPRTAALAGPATHIPGLFYLVALNLVVAHEPDWPIGMLEVILYNLVWFALPIIALGISIVRPSAAREAVGVVEDWTKEHIRDVIVSVSFVVGCLMIVRGLLTV